MQIRHSERPRAGAPLLTIAAVVIVLFLILVIAGAGLRSRDDSLGPERGVVLADLASHPGDYLGEKVRVSGEIERQLGPRLFLLESDGGKVLVLSEDPPELATERLAGDVDAGDVVVALGTVHEFEPEVLSRSDLVWEDAYEDHRGEPVVVARGARILSGPGERSA